MHAWMMTTIRAMLGQQARFLYSSDSSSILLCMYPFQTLVGTQSGSDPDAPVAIGNMPMAIATADDWVNSYET